MTTYNPNDYSPHSGRVIQEDGTVANEMQLADIVIQVPAQTIQPSGVIITTPDLPINGEYVAMSAYALFDATPTGCQIGVQEVHGIGTGTVSQYLNNAISTVTVPNNGVYQQRQPLQAGQKVHLVIKNTDTVAHNLLGAVVYAWRR